MQKVSIELPFWLEEWSNRGYLGRTKKLNNWPEKGLVSYFFGISDRPGSKIRLLGNINDGVLLNHQVVQHDTLVVDECLFADPKHVFLHPTIEEAIVWDLQDGYKNLGTRVLECHPFKKGLLVKKQNCIGYYAGRSWVWKRKKRQSTVPKKT